MGEFSKGAAGVVASRLDEIGLHTCRFINVKEGKKQSYNHTQREVDAVTGNYGVYCGGGLMGFDIDDYQDEAETTALEDLPATFTVSTPHDGEHRYYKSIRGAAATITSATGGARNISLSWGEIYAGGKYLVGPGSRITDCDKTNCQECDEYGGAYSIADDRPIAEITPNQVLFVLVADPDYAENAPQSALGMYGVQCEEAGIGRTPETRDRSSRAGSGGQTDGEQRRIDSFQ